MEDKEPYSLFDDWMAEARASEPNDSNAMTLATYPPVLATGAEIRPGGAAAVEAACIAGQEAARVRRAYFQARKAVQRTLKDQM